MATIGNVAQGKMDSILGRVLKDIRPSEDEIKAANAASNEIMGRLKKVAPKNVEIILAGSVARGTHIRGNSDIDIFLLFPKIPDERVMEKKGLEIAKKIVDKKRGERFIVKYAEHPYLQLIMKGVQTKADIVPAFKIRDSFEMGSAVDRTQLHNEFVMSHLTSRQKDQVRLLKAFLKFHSIYGAEAKTEGFSGYLCELLIHHYGSFPDLLAEFSNLWLPLCIDPKNRKPISDKEVFKKFNSDFVVIDPTDPNRNVAAVVSKESVARFVLAARKFIGHPTLEFFYGARFSDLRSSDKLKKVAKGLEADTYLLSFGVPDISEDIIWQQLKKLCRRFADILQKNGFNPLITLNAVSQKNASICFFINRYEINSRAREGPSVFVRSAADAFSKKHRSTYLREDRLVSLERSPYRNPKELIQGSISEIEFPSYIRKRNAKLLVNKISENDAKALYKKYIETVSI